MLYIADFLYPLECDRQYNYYLQDLFWLRLNLATNVGGVLAWLSTYSIDLAPGALQSNLIMVLAVLCLELTLWWPFWPGPW
jgi:hypothetical protein